MSFEVLLRHREVWRAKPILRYLYTDWYHDIVSSLRAGKTLEVGGGTGNLKEFSPGVISTDIVRLPWLDLVADAQRLPFAAHSFHNIVLFDTFHHIENVRQFFDEAARVLAPSGRIVIMDPYISWASWPVYHFLHPEPVDLRQDPLRLRPTDPNRKPFDSNQAIATILFERAVDRFRGAYPQFDIIFHRRLAFFAYPLSGGFDHLSLLPLPFIKPLVFLEKHMELLGRLFAFRILVVLQKESPETS